MKDKKNEATEHLLQAVIEREKAINRAMHKMNDIVIVEKRFHNVPVLEERRHA
jgi:hypothetical protein